MRIAASLVLFTRALRFPTLKSVVALKTEEADSTPALFTVEPEAEQRVVFMISVSALTFRLQGPALCRRMGHAAAYRRPPAVHPDPTRQSTELVSSPPSEESGRTNHKKSQSRTTDSTDHTDAEEVML